MAKKRKPVAKAKRPKSVATKSRTKTPVEAVAISERAVAIPEVVVFSELPFAKIGVIGGSFVNVTPNRTGSVQDVATIAGTAKKKARASAGSHATPRAAARRSAKR